MGDAHRLVSFSPDGKLVAGVWDGRIAIIDTQTSAITKFLPIQQGWLATDGFWDPLSGELVVAFHARGVPSYDVRTERTRVLVTSANVQNQVAKAGPEGVLWFGSGNQQDAQVGVAVWDVAKQRAVHLFNSGPTSVTEPTLAQGMDIAASVTDDGNVACGI